MSYDFEDIYDEMFGGGQYAQGSDDDLISRIIGRSHDEALSILSTQNIDRARAAKIMAHAGFGTTPTARSQPTVAKGFDEEGYQAFLAQATMYGFTREEVEQKVGRSKYRSAPEAMERFEDIVATGYGQFRAAEVQRQAGKGGGVLSPHLWAQMPEHLRARFTHSRPVPDPDPKKYMRVDLPDDYVWRKGQERIFHLGKALEASYIGQDPEGRYEMTTEPQKAIKRLQMLGAHQQVFLSGLPTFRGGIRAGPGAKSPDLFQATRAALIMGGEVGGAAGQGFLAPGLGDITQRSVREMAISDLPAHIKPDDLADVGAKWEMKEDVKLFEGHKGYESPWFETSVIDRVQTNIRKWDREAQKYKMVPGYRWVMEQRRPVEAGGLAAKMGSTKIQTEVADWVSGISDVQGQNLGIQLLASLKDPGGAIYEMFQHEYSRAKEAGDKDTMERIRTELGFKPGQKMPFSYAELSGRARERWAAKMEEHTQTIRATIPVHREQLQEGYFPEGVRVGKPRQWISPATGEAHPDIQEIDVEYQAIVGDFAKQYMMEYGIKRPFFGPEEFEQIEKHNPLLAEQIRDYGEPTRQAYQGLVGAHIATTGVSTYGQGEYYESSDPRVREAMFEAENLARAETAETEEGSLQELDPQEVAYRYFQHLRESDVGDLPIRWQEGSRVMYSQPMSQMAMMGAEGMLEETEVGGYLTSMHELMQRTGNPEAPALLTKAAEAQEKLAEAERATQRAQGYYGPPEVTLGGIATASTMLGIQETSIPNTEQFEAVQIGRYPTHPETWSTAASMINIGKEEMIARGLNPERFYASFQAQQMGRGDYDADLLIAARLGIAGVDPDTGELFNISTGEIMSKQQVKKAANEAIKQGAQSIFEEQVGGKGAAPSLATARADLRKALATPSRLSLGELREQMEAGRKLYEMIGPYYTTFQRKMMTHAKMDPKDKMGVKATEKLHQLSHGRAQRPELLPGHLQALQDLTTFTSKGGFYQRAAGTGGRPGAIPGVVGLRQYVSEALMHGVKAPVKEGRITPTEAAAIMAPLGKGRQDLRELYSDYQGAKTKEQRIAARSLIGSELAKLGSAGEWATGSIAGRMYAGQWATRVARDVLGEYDPLTDLNAAIRGPQAASLQKAFEGYDDVTWEDAKGMLQAAQQTAAYGTIVGKARERIEYNEKGEITGRSKIHAQRFAIASQVLGMNEWLPGQEASPEDILAAKAALGKLPIVGGQRVVNAEGVHPFAETYATAARATEAALGYITPSEMTAAARGPGAHLKSLTERTMRWMTPKDEATPRLARSENESAMVRGTLVHEEWQRQEEWPTTEEALDQDAVRKAFGINIGTSGYLDVPFTEERGLIDIKPTAGLAGATTPEQYQAMVRKSVEKYIPQLSLYHHAKGGARMRISAYDPLEAKQYGESKEQVEALVRKSREREAQFGGPVDITDMLMSREEMESHIGHTLKQRTEGGMSDRITQLAAGRMAGVIEPIKSKWGKGDDPEFARLMENLQPAEQKVLDLLMSGASDQEIADAIGSAGAPPPGQGPPAPPGAPPGGGAPGGGPGGGLAGGGFDMGAVIQAFSDAIAAGGGIPPAQITYERTPMSQADMGRTLGSLRRFKGMGPIIEQLQGREGWGKVESQAVHQLQQVYKQLGTAQQRRAADQVSLPVTEQLAGQLEDLGFTPAMIKKQFGGVGGQISGVQIQSLARSYQDEMTDVMAELLPRDIAWQEQELQAKLEEQLGIAIPDFSEGERMWMQTRATPERLAAGVSGLGPAKSERLLKTMWAPGVKNPATLQKIKGIGAQTVRGISEGVPEAIGQDLRGLADRLSKKMEVTADDVEEVNQAFKILADPKFKDVLSDVRQKFENVLDSVDELGADTRKWARRTMAGEWDKMGGVEAAIGEGKATPQQRSWLASMAQLEPMTRRPGMPGGETAERIAAAQNQLMRQSVEEGLGIGGGGRGGLARRAGGVMSDVLQEFSIGGAAIRMAVIGRYTSGQVRQMEAAAEPYEMAGLQYQLAMGVPYGEAMKGTMGNLLSYQAAQRSFQMGFGSQALKQKAGVLGMLGIEPSFEMGETIGGVGAPILKGLGAGLSAGVLASTVSSIAGKAGMGTLATLAGGAIAPLALIAGTAVGGAALAGQVYSETQPEALQRQYLEHEMGLRDRPGNVWSDIGTGWRNMTGQLSDMFSGDYETRRRAWSGESYNQRGTEEKQRIQESYAGTAQFRIDKASMYLERSLELNLDPAQARELGSLLTLGGYTPEQIYSGSAYPAIERLAPMAALGQAGAQMSAVERFGNYLGVAPGVGLQGWLTELPTVAQPAQQAQWLMAAQTMGSAYGQVGLTPTIQQVQQFAGQLGEGVPMWQAQLQMQQQLGTLPVVQALGYEPGSPMGRLLSGQITPGSQAEAQFSGQMASQYRQIADVLGLSGTEAVQYTEGLAERLRGREVEMHTGYELPPLGDIMAELLISQPQLTGREREQRAKELQWERAVPQTESILIPAEDTPEGISREQQRIAGMLAGPSGFAAGSARARMLSFTAPEDYTGFEQWTQAQSIMAGPLTQAFGLGAADSAQYTLQAMRALQQGVSPQALGLATQMMMGQGTAQAFGAPMGIGQTNNNLTAAMLLSGKLNYQEYQQTLSQAQYGLGEMGRSMIIGGFGFGAELQQARADMGIPLQMEGALPQYEQTPWGIQRYGRYAQLQRQQGMMYAQQAKQMGTGAWATQTVTPWTADVPTTITSLTEDQREQYAGQIEAAQKAGSGVINIPTEFGGQTFQMGMIGDLQMAKKKFATWQAGRSMQREMAAMQYENQQRGNEYAIAMAQMQYRHGMESLGLQQRMWQSNVGFQRQEMGHQYAQMQTRREWQVEDLAYSREMAGLQYGWQMEDMDRNIMFATGRQKEQLIRQRGRAEEMFSRQEGKRETDEGRAEEAYKWQEEAHARRRQQFEETTALQSEQFQMQKRHMTESFQLQMAHLQEQADAAGAMYEKQKELEKLQGDMAEEEMLYRIAQQQQAIEYYEKVVFPNQEAEMQLQMDIEKANAQYMQDQIDAMKKGGKLYSGWWDMINRIWKWLKGIGFGMEEGGGGSGGGSGSNTGTWICTVCGAVNSNDSESCKTEGCPGTKSGGAVNAPIVPPPSKTTVAGSYEDLLTGMQPPSGIVTEGGDTYNITITVSGAGDPTAVATAVADEFERRINKLAEKQRSRGVGW